MSTEIHISGGNNGGQIKNYSVFNESLFYRRSRPQPTCRVQSRSHPRESVRQESLLFQPRRDSIVVKRVSRRIFTL